MLRLFVLVLTSGILALAAGPASAQDKPTVIDTVGPLDTEVAVQRHNGRRKILWAPIVRVFVQFAGYSSDDLLLVQLKKGRRKLGKPFKCKPTTSMKELYRKGAPVLPIGILYFDCVFGEEHGQTIPGRYELGLSYKQTLAGKVFKDFATLKLNVLKLLQGNRDKPNTTYTEDDDMRLGVTTISEYAGNASRSRRYNVLENAVKRAHKTWHQNYAPWPVVRLWLKSAGKSIDSKLTCFFKGKKFDEAGSNGALMREYWTFPRPRKAEIKVRWEEHQFELKRTFFEPPYGFKKGEKRGANRHWLSQNPGDYRCVLTADGDILKEIFFKVDAKGEIVKTACQAQVNTLRHVTIVETRERKSKAKYDQRLARKYAFAGHVTWTKGCPPLRK